MEAALDQPVVVLLAVALAAVLVLLELALPTVGVAGLAALVLSGLAVWGVVRQDLAWWPLPGVAVGVLIWGALIGRSHASLKGRVVAGVLYGVGAIGFGLTNGDVTTLFVADVSALVLPFLFPWIMRIAGTLLSLPPQVGMEGMVGKLGTVAIWSGRSGIVRVEGALWNATGMSSAGNQDHVLVTDVKGISLVVTPTMPRWDDESSEPTSS
ncbi:MAG: NfeD family protein [Acidobacteria bacterium]|nr:NfeD family protein [Acidobacteriota bacterium]